MFYVVKRINLWLEIMPNTMCSEIKKSSKTEDLLFNLQVSNELSG